MATKNLSKRVVDSLAFTPERDYFVWDTNLKGFGVRVTARAGSDGVVRQRKVFVIGYRPRGSRRFRRLTIGTYGAVTVDQARSSARRHLSAVNDGIDPMEVSRAARAELTVREAGESYLADVAIRRKPSTAREYERLWRKHVLPSLGSRKVTEVTSPDIRRLHRSLNATPYSANRVLALLGAFFTFAAKEALCVGMSNPTREVEWYHEQGRERFLDREEFARLGDALTRAETHGIPPAPNLRRRNGDPNKRKHVPKSAATPLPANPFAVAAIRVLALTGCREGEVLGLRWDEVDFERGHLRLGDTKTGRSVRPLGDSAAEVLRGIQRVAGSPFVFPGRETGTHLHGIKRLWYAVRFAAGVPDLRLHDLRHSYASVSAASGESLLIVRALLGHARVATTERYAHLSNDPVRRAANATSAEIAGLLGSTDTSVTPLRGRAARLA